MDNEEYEDEEYEPLEENENNIIKYNIQDFNLDIIIRNLQKLKLIKDKRICTICNNDMKLHENKNYKDKYYWRCKKSLPQKHDNKINLRDSSIFETFLVDIRVLYFLLLYCFMENKSLKVSLRNVKQFCKDINIDFIALKTIIKFYRIVRHQIKINLHKEWEVNQLGIGPTQDGIPRLELDESKIITYDNSYQMDVWYCG